MKRLFPLVFVLVTSTAQSEILKVKIDGIIDPITSEFITGAIGQAGQDKVEFLLIELSTPGGLGVSMQEIIQNILNSEIPIVCYVEPKGARAASAGFFVLLSADVAAMAPGTNTGAAHPVLPFGMENEKLLEKVTNDALANLRAIVKQRKRNYELAEKGVLESKSYTAREALEGGLIDLISENEEELLKELHGREITRFSGEIQKISTEGQQVKLLEMTVRQKILSTIADPNLALILGVVGLLGLYLEFTSPGLLVPGVLGGICLLLSLLGFSLLPISLVGVLLIVLALGLFIAELKVQGFGLFGIGGIVAMTFGLLLLIDAPNPEVRIHKGFAFAVAISFGIIMVFLLRLVIKSHMAKVITGTGSLEGDIGEARTQIDQEGGKVFIKGEWWQAVCDEPVAAGSKVRVLGAKDLVLTVEPCSRSNAKSSK
ncbi:nodulation protein NfeD [Acidobacteria bacterium AH-259-O06]|nr:nodulation protein NfeD [Acidobacteria bacterium AH-259-O06]